MKSLNRGITLITVTIIVVIILLISIITIRILRGNGIIIQAHKTETNNENEEGILEKNISELLENLKGKNNNIASTTEEGVPIPKGFKYIEGTKDTGVVIENEKDGSQFVWVPVAVEISEYGLDDLKDREPDIVSYDRDTSQLAVINSILGTEYTNSQEFLKGLQKDFEEMKESVNKNGGFYVGRGVISKAAETSDRINWYQFYAIQKAYSTDSVQGSMIYGSQYNAMMSWIGNAAKKKIGDNRNKERTTGTKETDVINNIYDLYGNIFEWTIEASTVENRNARGGSCNYNASPSNSIPCEPAVAYSDVGSRITLYIK